MFAENKTTIKDYTGEYLMKLYWDACYKRMSSKKTKEKFNEIDKIEKILWKHYRD